MTKKLLIIVSALFALLFISTASYATTNTNHNAANVIHNTAAGAIQGTNNLIHNAVSGAENAMHNNANTPGITNHAGTTTTTHPNATTTNRVATHYGTTRTATDATNNATRTTNMVTWVALGIAAVVIVGLVWYYSSNDVRRDR